MRNLIFIWCVLLLSCQKTADRNGDAASREPAPSAKSSEPVPEGPAVRPRTTVTPTSNAKPVAEAPHPAPDQITATPETRVLWEETVDLDGDRVPELVRLSSTEVRSEGDERSDEEATIPVRGCAMNAPTCSAVLQVGKAEKVIELTPGYFGGIDFSIIDINSTDGRKEVLYRRRAPGHVDPPFVFTVGIYDGERLNWQELDEGFGYDAGTIKAPGNGVLTTEYDACSEVTTARYRLDKAGLQKLDMATKQVRDPNQCAACPHVYVEIAGKFVSQGEILRNLSSPQRNGHQALRLHFRGTSPQDELVHVQLREEKAETTYLDSVWIEVNGVSYAPTACGRESYCTTDSVFHEIAQGEVLDLHFALPSTTEFVQLEAVGHYIPRKE